MNLLMLSSDSSVAQGQDSTFNQMLRRFSTYWSRIDVISPRASGATVPTAYGNVYLHPSPWHKWMQPYFIRQTGRSLFREREYALVVSHDYGFFTNGLGAYWLTRGTNVPYVSEIHHVEGYPQAVTTRERLYRWTAMRYIRWMHKHAAAIRTVNALEIPNLLRQLGVPEEKIRVLPSLYIDFDLFHPLPDEPRRYDVLFVGRLMPNKGIFTLLEAVAQVRETYARVRLGIRGDGPLRAEIEARITALDLVDNVTLIPRLDSMAELARLYNQAGMLVCASTAEGGPRVTVEAMACGTAVISTPVGIMPELIDDGENGLLYYWGSAELAVKIGLLLDDAVLRQQIAEAGRQSVQHFQADAIIEHYTRAYLDLIHTLQKG